MKRVLVIGPGGAGKSTLARALAQRTGLPLIHLDALYWCSGWTPTPNEEWDEQIAQLVARETWVLDGNYGRTLTVRLAACDTVVFLDLPRLVCIWRVFRRRLQFRGRGRADLTPDCPERLTWEFIRWIWTYRSRRRPEVLRHLAAVSHVKSVIVLRRARAVREYLAGLNVGSSAD